jgi:hypothetical protein
MAKSKPIGVRFDENVVKRIQEKYPQFETHQSILNFLMDIYLPYENMKELTRHQLITNMKRGAPFKNMPPYDTDAPKLEVSSKLEQIPVENHKTPPKGLKGIDLMIWKSENGI